MAVIGKDEATRKRSGLLVKISDQTRWSGFDDKIISLYACGLTVHEIQGHLQEMYGAKVSPSLIYR